VAIFCFVLLCTILFFSADTTQQQWHVPLFWLPSRLTSQRRCPSPVNYSHPTFVCPPAVLANRAPLRTTRGYESLGGNQAFMSQFGEDWFVYSEFFHAPEYNNSNGTFTFVELGGYDGFSGSNSWFFERTLGWRGLLLEASTGNYVKLEKRRLSERTLTIHGGVCLQRRLLDLWGGDSLTANNRKEASGLFHDAVHSLALCAPMTDYLAMVVERGMRIDRIDYFSMDVEGQELEIILSHDWYRVPVRVVSVEMAVQPLLSGTAEYQHEKRCALFQRGMCRWPFYNASETNEIWVNPLLL